MNKTCPNCGYELHRRDHPVLGFIRFCRRSCIRAWLHVHNRPQDTAVYVDKFTVQKRAA